MLTREEFTTLTRELQQKIGMKDHTIEVQQGEYRGELIVSIAPVPLWRKDFSADRFIKQHGETIGFAARAAGFHQTEVRCAKSDFTRHRL